MPVYFGDTLVSGLFINQIDAAVVINGANVLPGISKISFIGQASAASNTVTLPTHQTGDLILVSVYRGADPVLPVVPSGYTTISSGGVTNNAHSCGYKIATSSSETSGTWTNGELITVQIYRGASGCGAFSVGSGNGDLTYPAFNLNDLSGKSWVSCLAGIRSAVTALESPPTGTTLRSNLVGTWEIASFDTNGGVSTWPLRTVPAVTAVRYRTVVVEILSN